MSEGGRVDAAAAVLGALARRDEPLGPLTTYRVGGRAALAVEPKTELDLHTISTAVTATGLPVLVVGRGSNLLVADAGFEGVAVLLGDAFGGIEIAGTLVSAGGGASLPVVARRSASAGLTGFEWAVGVPGSIGGAVRMNAGGHGSDIAAVLVRARVADLGSGSIRWRPATDLDLGYRHSNVAPTDVVVAAELRCARGDAAVSEATIAEIVRWRRTNQPGGQNAGSVFTNPTGDSAGRIVDAAGLKGFRIGSAQVSTKHANFIQADDGGRADDVRALIREVQRLVLERAGIALQTEIRLIGFAGTYPREMDHGASGGA